MSALNNGEAIGRRLNGFDDSHRCYRIFRFWIGCLGTMMEQRGFWRFGTIVRKLEKRSMSAGTGCLPRTYRGAGFRVWSAIPSLEEIKFYFLRNRHADVLWSPEYMERLGNPTDWTQRVMQVPFDKDGLSQGVIEGSAMGGHTVTFRTVGAAGPDAVLEQQLQDIILTELSEQRCLPCTPLDSR